MPTVADACLQTALGHRRRSNHYRMWARQAEALGEAASADRLNDRADHLRTDAHWYLNRARMWREREAEHANA